MPPLGSPMLAGGSLRPFVDSSRAATGSMRSTFGKGSGAEYAEPTSMSETEKMLSFRMKSVASISSRV
eukprot:CAMPEP_0117465200 /NCGR_PEP_ID=MMETSP0784-20121206/4503_1 /TAXON_ID=39447 /ORGANISM="" /LENGTH=67 /DNA_ID=CAMNT_0005259101 /DNA_START=908 /DNA_END=1111 /DNA_ORIENTATION=-